MDNEHREENIQISDDRDFWFSHLDICVMQDKNLSFAAKGIYALLTTYMDVKSRSWSVKIKTLSETAGISERQVRYAVKELKEKGYIKVEEVFREGHQCASKYTLIGHRASEQTAIYAPQDCTPCTPRGAYIAGQLLEPVLQEPKELPPISPKAERREKTQRHVTEYTPEFESFWKLYPNNRGKQKAWRMWLICLKGRASPDAMIRAAKRYSEECREMCRETRFILHASTFLGPDERWKDYDRPASVMGQELQEVDIEKFKLPGGGIDAKAYERARRGITD